MSGCLRMTAHGVRSVLLGSCAAARLRRIVLTSRQHDAARALLSQLDLRAVQMPNRTTSTPSHRAAPSLTGSAHAGLPVGECAHPKNRASCKLGPGGDGEGLCGSAIAREWPQEGPTSHTTHINFTGTQFLRHRKPKFIFLANY